MKKALILALYSLLTYAAAQDNFDDLINEILDKPNSVDKQNVDDLINEIYGPSTNAASPSSNSCNCVPLFRCKSTVVQEINLRVDDNPCDYLSVCCKEEDVLPENDIPSPKLFAPITCGQRNSEGVGLRISGDADNESQFAEFPWMVAVFREEPVQRTNQTVFIYQCGAALIHPQAVLTSAHCVVRKDKTFKVRAGEWDRLSRNEAIEHQDRNVQTVIIHPDFYSGGLYNDIAILILDAPVVITGNVNVVCLPKQNMVVDDTSCVVSGWGKNVSGRAGKYQVILKKLELAVVAKNICQDRLRSTQQLGAEFQLHDSFICAGGEFGKSTCKGDGGSPLVCRIPGEINKYFQAGIASWGIGCGDNQIPEVYANVASFSNWIDEQITSNNLDTSFYKY